MTGEQKALAFAIAVMAGLIAFMYTIDFSQGRDLDGRYAASPLKEWFSGLRSPGGGRCCDEADGTGVEAIDWDTSNSHYRVRIDGEWRDVPDDRVVMEPNRMGNAMVWTYGSRGARTIRCFMPGSMG